ncbi:MAG TPA: PASTA domain-containing protein [Solirubrobacterales bacterium]
MRRVIAVATIVGMLALGWVGCGNSEPTPTRRIAIPNVIAIDQDRATRILADYGFATAVQTVRGDAESILVLEQSPPPGSKAPKGSTVTITAPSGTFEAVDHNGPGEGPSMRFQTVEPQAGAG